jgi:hypothetical protein
MAAQCSCQWTLSFSSDELLTNDERFDTYCHAYCQVELQSRVLLDERIDREIIWMMPPNGLALASRGCPGAVPLCRPPAPTPG